MKLTYAKLKRPTFQILVTRMTERKNVGHVCFSLMPLHNPEVQVMGVSFSLMPLHNPEGLCDD